MSEQSVEKIIDTLTQYRVPMFKLYTIIAIVGAVGAVVCLIFFVVIFAIIIKGFCDMGKDWNNFKRR